MEKSSSNANLLPAPSSLSAQKHQWTSNIRLNPINREHHPPFSVLWAPLPFISWVLPLVGHVAITDSRGNVYDFAGSFRINTNNMMTGSPVRVLNMIPIFEKEFGTELHEYSLNAEKWDIAITRGNEIFTHKRHNLILQNCHNHVATCLNLYGSELIRSYPQYQLEVEERNEGEELKQSWNAFKLWWRMLIDGKPIGNNAFGKTWIGVIILITMILLGGLVLLLI